MSAYEGTGRLVRLALRRDRVQLPVWIVGSAVILAAGAAAVIDEFPDAAGRATALQGAGTSPAVLLMRGTPVGTDLGALANFRNLAFMLVLAALMSTFAVVRHTRQNEETGRAEMIGAASVGRNAGLTAALTVVLGANLVLGVALIGALVSAGLPAGGAVTFGAACAVTGMAFAGVAAVGAQLFQSARAANAFAATAVGVAYLVRGIGDALGERAADGVQVTSTWFSWVSPLGWGMLARPYGEERWWVLTLPVLLLIACVWGAFALVGRRDLGAGLIPERPGPAAASRGLLSPLGLAWRLNRASTIGWLVGSVVFGLGIGSLGDLVDDALGGNEGVSDLMGQLAGTGSAALVEAFFAAMMNVFGALAACFAVQVLLRLRSEEAGGPAEAVLATAVGRARWVGAHLTCAVGGAAAILVLAGAATGLADAAVGGDIGVLTLVGAGLAQLPAAMTVAGFVVLVFGGLPRMVVVLAWAGLVVSLACGLLGDVFGLPQAVRDVSPFTHVPAIPAVDATPGPMVGLVVVAAALAAAGMALFRRRDLSP
ncbi:ABC transporter permease [Planotetraspora phitsanulokensis]|uniref:Exporter of polyketide antibiotics n=1 Tax=Planotetraspora phitsanulokensis TaxID=575192 RepID=A0A8J3UC45_9ACTN|nr:ABC transporter permease [Planotetraspora phitsanulokensis]GII42085.1 exporter of polyketide antibiotics [Planotetraspora phitsanulokensis]